MHLRAIKLFSLLTPTREFEFERVCARSSRQSAQRAISPARIIIKQVESFCRSNRKAGEGEMVARGSFAGRQRRADGRQSEPSENVGKSKSRGVVRAARGQRGIRVPSLASRSLGIRNPGARDRSHV